MTQINKKAIINFDIVNDDIENKLKSCLTIYDSNYTEIYRNKDTIDNGLKKKLFIFSSILSSFKFIASKDLCDVILIHNHNIDSKDIQTILLKLTEVSFNFSSFRLIEKSEQLLSDSYKMDIQNIFSNIASILTKEEYVFLKLFILKKQEINYKELTDKFSIDVFNFFYFFLDKEDKLRFHEYLNKNTKMNLILDKPFPKEIIYRFTR